MISFLEREKNYLIYVYIHIYVGVYTAVRERKKNNLRSGEKDKELFNIHLYVV